LSNQPTSGRLPAGERRRSIEDAASRIFAERGYAGTSLDEVAEAVGVTKPVIYRHFDSKKDLHLALLARHRDELLGLTARAMGGSAESLKHRFERAVSAWFGYVESHPYALKMLFRDTTGDPEIEAFHEEMHATARAALRAMLEAEPGFDLSDELRDPLAEMLRAGNVGLVLWWADHPEVPRDRVVRLAMDAIWGGVGPYFGSVESAS
jgi:AcrR family transcriptional regulator